MASIEGGGECLMTGTETVLERKVARIANGMTIGTWGAGETGRTCGDQKYSDVRAATRTSTGDESSRRGTRRASESAWSAWTAGSGIDETRGT